MRSAARIIGAVFAASATAAGLASAQPADDPFAGLDFSVGAGSVAQFDIEGPEADWAPAPMADAAAFDVEVDGRGRRVREEDPGVVGATLGALKSDLLAR